MATKRQNQGIVAALGEVLESVADVVNGEIFGEDSTDDNRSTKREPGRKQSEPVKPAVSAGGSDTPAVKPKSIKDKLAAAFRASDADAEKGETVRVDESAEDSGAKPEETA
jgi:hypothetical protein